MFLPLTIAAARASCGEAKYFVKLVAVQHTCSKEINKESKATPAHDAYGG